MDERAITSKSAPRLRLRPRSRPFFPHRPTGLPGSYSVGVMR
jgi:hypothetical protein